MAIDAPLLIAPAMDDRMYLNPIMQKNIKILQDVGYKFVGPEKGRLASGRIGIGRMADVELIIQLIIGELENTSKRKVDLLVKGINAENKIKSKKEKRLRRSTITKIYESSGKRYGSVRSS
jgi:phosphopantothenoylcysteine synthetase/decarboxylase